MNEQWLNRFRLIVAAVLMLSGSANSATIDGTVAEKGTFVGAKTVVHPSWFKESFLDFAEDIDEAEAEGKRLVLYFWQEGCPYCNQLWEHNMAEEGLEAKFRENFDVVAINIWGNKDVVTVGGKEYSEKQLTKAFDINYTPTLIFYSENKKPALRLNGYYPPKAFDAALDYVREKQESVMSFSAYRTAKEPTVSGNERIENTQSYFRPIGELPTLLNTPTDKPLMVLFEAPDCEPCNVFHQKTLVNAESAKLLAQMDVVQLNAFDNTTKYEINDKQLTASQWANDLGIAYYPSLVFFDKVGEHIMQIDSSLRTFHIQSVFAYIGEGAYLTEPNFQRYISNRADHLLEQGIEVDIWRY